MVPEWLIGISIILHLMKEWITWSAFSFQLSVIIPTFKTCSHASSEMVTRSSLFSTILESQALGVSAIVPSLLWVLILHKSVSDAIHQDPLSYSPGPRVWEMIMSHLEHLLKNVDAVLLLVTRNRWKFHKRLAISMQPDLWPGHKWYPPSHLRYLFE